MRTLLRIRVLTFCILTHHLLLRGEEVLDCFEALPRSAVTPGRLRKRLEPFRADGDAARQRAFLDGIWISMGNLSGCHPRFKQRFRQH